MPIFQAQAALLRTTRDDPDDPVPFYKRPHALNQYSTVVWSVVTRAYNMEDGTLTRIMSAPQFAEVSGEAPQQPQLQGSTCLQTHMLTGADDQ